MGTSIRECDEGRPVVSPQMSAPIARLSRLVRVVCAPNPSHMTLEGTNSYLVGTDHGVVVIDPGPDVGGHWDRLRGEIGDTSVMVVALSHWHQDHADGPEVFARSVDAPLCSWDPRTEGEVQALDAERVGGKGVSLFALHTPGHSRDHLCFHLQDERAVFTGDHVLGRGTTVISYPDGDMALYLDSLRRLRGLGLRRLYPGHGPVIEDPDRVLDEYMAHRLMRERQVLSQLPGTPEELVARIYTDVDPILHPAAAMSVRAHLTKLAAEGLVADDGGEHWRLRGAPGDAERT